MVLDTLETTNIRINLKLKSGEIFEGKDITSLPAGKNEVVISFWIDENKIRVYPLSEIEYYEYIFGQD